MNQPPDKPTPQNPAQDHEPAASSSPPINQPPKHSDKKLLIGVIALLVLMLVLMAAIIIDLTGKKTVKIVPAAGLSKSEQAASAKAKTVGLQLDPKKTYGDKYKDGILPVGDNRYVTDTAKTGYVYLCRANFVPAGQAGASARGPWFVGTSQYDINKKPSVSGQVVWIPKLDVRIVSDKRLITTNDEPNHVSGVFPVSPSDPAYIYDRNPNTITAQSLEYDLNANPTNGLPRCMGGEAGVMLTGVALFNAFDAGGRDAGAWEVQDSCNGHPQNKGEYHYHTLSSCLTDTSVSTVIGYALDGFPITGPKVNKDNILTTADLDVCHGLTSQINVDDKNINSYHYVMTQDFPYSVSCFRSAAIQPPGNHDAPTHP